jgi:protoporphyrinogen oxidase
MIAVLGAGFAGLSAAYELRKKGKKAVVYEKNDTCGGLCRSFTIEGFTFDTFAHVNFSKDSYVMSMLEEKTPYLTHSPEATNYYHGAWIRNPAQNNLVNLPVEERVRVIADFVRRDENRKIENYRDWLLAQYGTYFTEHFPAAYTRKYWTVEPQELETKWVEGRMYTPSLEEVLYGAMSGDSPNVHYSKEIHYPKNGGYGAFLQPFMEGADIRTKKQVTGLDAKKKKIFFSDGEEVGYEKLISTIPLNELISCMGQVPEEINKAAKELEYTSGVMVSLGLNRENVAPELWFYIYDEEIYPARVYAPNIKSPNNVPKGCCALQAEIYFSKRKPLTMSLEELKEGTIRQFIKMGLMRKEDILVQDVRMEEYANIMFTPGIYEARAKVHQYLEECGVRTAGRFGEWDYLWTGQSILSGKRAAEKIGD